MEGSFFPFAIFLPDFPLLFMAIKTSRVDLWLGWLGCYQS
jgi:hypothetical protein